MEHATHHLIAIVDFKMWYELAKNKIAASKDATYFSIGHSRDYDNIILWVHDGQQLHTKTSTPKQKTHMSAFQGINDIARGRIDKAKNISSIAFDIEPSISVMQQNYLRKKVLSDLKKQFPTVNISEHGQILKEEDNTFASSNLSLKTAQFGAGYGEWWIDDSGQTMYADIDIGDKGHEQFVIEHAQGMVIPANYHDYSEDSWNNFFATLADDLLDEAHGNPIRKQHIENFIGEDLERIKPKDLIEQDYIEEYIIRELGANKELMDIAMGRGDVRLFGVKELGWKRVMNKFVETWFFRPQDCALISRGLGDIAQDDEEGTTKWTIEVRSANKVYVNIPLYIIDKGPIAVNNYSRQSQD